MPSLLQIKSALTLKHHALFDALLEAAVLTAIPLSFGDFAGPICNARVNPSILNGPLEETFAPFASDDAVMQASRPILTNHANHWLLKVLVVWMQRRAGTNSGARSAVAVMPVHETCPMAAETESAAGARAVTPEAAWSVAAVARAVAVADAVVARGEVECCLRGPQALHAQPALQVRRNRRQRTIVGAAVVV